jgi:hypothetical protein
LPETIHRQKESWQQESRSTMRSRIYHSRVTVL